MSSVDKKVKKILFVFENCEHLEIQAKDIIEIKISDIEKKTSCRKSEISKTLKISEIREQDIFVIINKSSKVATDIRCDATYFDIIYTDRTFDSIRLPWRRSDGYSDSSYQSIKTLEDSIIWCSKKQN